MMDVSYNFDEFYARYYGHDIVSSLGTIIDSGYFNVSYHYIEIFDITLADRLCNSPDDILSELSVGLSQYILIEFGKKLDDIFIRISDYPDTVGFNTLRTVDVGKLVSIKGKLIRGTKVTPKEVVSANVCQKCGCVNYIEQNGFTIVKPKICDNDACLSKGPFVFDVEKSDYIDSQLIRIQELSSASNRGAGQDSLDVILYNGLAGSVIDGGDLIITGILRIVPDSDKPKSMTRAFVFEANHIQKQESYNNLELTEKDVAECFDLRNNQDVFSTLVSSFAPDICDMDSEKEAIVLCMFSGGRWVTAGNSDERGNSHLLIVGDPGIAKSQLLSHVAKISPRCIRTSGTGSSGVGLTASVGKDDFANGAFALQAGALVLADNGDVVIDEFDKMEKDDRNHLHDAMEDQFVTISKAGINATLNTRCTVFAAANPIDGVFDIISSKSLIEQVKLPPTLLSRFDIIILHPHIYARENESKIVDSIFDAYEGVSKNHSAIISYELFRKYISYAKQEFTPKVPRDVLKLLKEYYLDLNDRSSSDSIPVTRRLLKSLIRLTEASARLELREIAIVADAERAIRVISWCIDSVFTDSDGNLDWAPTVVNMGQANLNNKKRFKRLIRDNTNKDDNRADHDEVVNLALAAGFTKESIKDTIKELSRAGELMKPTKSTLRLIQ